VKFGEGNGRSVQQWAIKTLPSCCRFSPIYFLRRSPRLIFQVVGLSRDDVPTVVKAGSHHPGSHYELFFFTSGHAAEM